MANTGKDQMKYLYDKEGRKTVECSEYVVIGNNITFGKNVKIGPFCIIHDNSVIEEGKIIKPYTQVFPKKSNADKTLNKILKGE